MLLIFDLLAYFCVLNASIYVFCSDNLVLVNMALPKKYQAAVPEGMQDSINGVYEGNTPLPIWSYIFKYFR